MIQSPYRSARCFLTKLRFGRRSGQPRKRLAQAHPAGDAAPEMPTYLFLDVDSTGRGG